MVTFDPPDTADASLELPMTSSLPASWYVRDAHFELERETLWASSWVAVCRERGCWQFRRWIIDQVARVNGRERSTLA